jgi:repressor LexA
MTLATASHDLTARQREVLAWISAHLARHGYAPTLREMGQAFGFNVSAAASHRDALQRKGLLHHTPGRPRSMLVVTGGSGSAIITQ